jgi:hypothetical protein
MKAMAPRLSGPVASGILILGYVKQITYRVRIHSIQHLKRRIKEHAAVGTADILGRVWQEMEYRLDICRATNGVHIELR